MKLKGYIASPDVIQGAELSQHSTGSTGLTEWFPLRDLCITCPPIAHVIVY